MATQTTIAVRYEQLGLVAYELEQWEAARTWYAKALRAASEGENYWACGMICNQLSAAFRAEQRVDEAVTWSILAIAAFDDGSGRVASDIVLPSAVRTTDLVDAWEATTGAAPPPGVRQNVERLLSPSSN